MNGFLAVLHIYQNVSDLNLSAIIAHQSVAFWQSWTYQNASDMYLAHCAFNLVDTIGVQLQ